MENIKIKFETANLAKLKGFDEFNRCCDSGYNPNTGKIIESQIWDMICNVKESVGRPTQSLLQKWLRDEHNIDIQVICNHSEKLGKHYLLGIIYIINNQVESFIIKETDVNIDYVNKMFITYEEALEIGLYESLKLINNEE